MPASNKLFFASVIFLFSCCFALEREDAANFIKKVLRLQDLDNKDCVQQLQHMWINLVNATGDNYWALKMIDAGAKIPAGLLDFHLLSAGDFNECLQIDSQLVDLKGKYCLVSIGLDADSILSESLKAHPQYEEYNTLTKSASDPMMIGSLPSFGICVPDKCTDVDIQNLASSVLSVIPWNVTCQTKEGINHPHIGATTIFALTFFSFIACLMIFSTLYDVLLLQKIIDGKPHPLLKAFSMYTNSKRLFTISHNPAEFSCLNGIRVLSMMWVIFLHVMVITLYSPIYNLVDAIRFLLHDRKSSIFLNASFSVDSFLVITGMLVIYNFMKSHRKGENFSLLPFYRHRYIRLSAPLIPIIIYYVGIMNHLGSGPYFPQMDAWIAGPCRINWWAALLHVQNYFVSSNHTCVVQAWYVDVDWQLYVIAPLFLICLARFPKTGLALLAAALVASMANNFYITWDKKLASTNLAANFLDYTKYYYFYTHTRAGPWLIGALLGYLMAKIKLEKKIDCAKLPYWMILSSWIVALVTLPVIVFASFDAQTSLTNRIYSNSFFNSFARPAWGVCVSWIIFACLNGYGGFINTILSLPIFQLINKFSYSMYLLHYGLIYLIIYSQQQAAFFSFSSLSYNYWTFITTSFFLSVVWVLAFEMPILNLEKYFMAHGVRVVTSKVSKTNA